MTVDVLVYPDHQPWSTAQSPKYRMSRAQRQGDITPPKTNNANTVTSTSLRLRWAGILTSSSSGRSQMAYTRWRKSGDSAAVSPDEQPRAEQTPNMIEKDPSLRPTLPLLFIETLRQRMFAKISMRHPSRATGSESMHPTGSLPA